MKFLYYLIILLLLITASCTTINVVNVKEVQEQKDNALIYCLPRNIIRISIEITNTVYKRGPYYEYAEKYLGIKDVIKADKNEHRITDIHLNTYAEPDSALYFLIQAKGKNIADHINLTEDGLLLALNRDVLYEENNPEMNLNNLQKKTNNIVFTDLSVKRNYIEKNTTVIKRVKKDTSYIKVPVRKTSIIEKTFEEKAEEAANFIIKLRKRRFKLLAGIYEKFPEGEALGIMISELNILEKEYVSLFAGKTIDEVKIYSFEYVPGNDLTPVELFIFSEEKGISDNNEYQGVPVYIEITKEGNTDSLDSFLSRNKENEKLKNGIFYRIPDYAIINIRMDNRIIASARLLIAQYGTITALPARIFKNKSIEFYPQYGSLKSISR